MERLFNEILRKQIDCNFKGGSIYINPATKKELMKYYCNVLSVEDNNKIFGLTVINDPSIDLGYYKTETFDTSLPKESIPVLEKLNKPEEDQDRKFLKDIMNSLVNKWGKEWQEMLEYVTINVRKQEEPEKDKELNQDLFSKISQTGRTRYLLDNYLKDIHNMPEETTNIKEWYKSPEWESACNEWFEKLLKDNEIKIQTKEEAIQILNNIMNHPKMNQRNTQEEETDDNLNLKRLDERTEVINVIAHMDYNDPDYKKIVEILKFSRMI